MCSEHKHLSFKDRFIAKGEMHSHLVTVEVGVKCRTCERVQLDCLSFDHFRLECLYAESVKCRGTVEEDGMSFHHILENIPYDRLFAVNDFLS